MNPRTDRAGHSLDRIFLASGRIIRDERLDAVSGYRTWVDKGGH